MSRPGARGDLRQLEIERRLRPIPGSLAILALGKLGGGELGYAADLDVVFVYQGDDDADGNAIEHYSKLAQRLLGALRQRTPRGRFYEVDTRLRPSGTAGLLGQLARGLAQVSRRRARSCGSTRR